MLTAPSDQPRTATSEGAAPNPGKRYGMTAALLVAASLACVWWTGWVCDDAYITFRHVQNCLAGYGPVFNPGERVQAYTHPLWFLLLLAGGTVINLHALAMLLGLVGTAAMIAFLALRLRGQPLGGYRLALYAGFLLSSRSFVEFQTSGLETSLTTLLITLLWGDLLLGARTALPVGRIAVLCSCLVLNRPDHAVLVSPLLLVAMISAVRRRQIRRLLAGFSPLVLWGAFATVYYGTPFPNTAYAKVAFALGRAIDQGLFYVVDFTRAEPFPAAAAALICGAGLVQLARGIRHNRSFSLQELALGTLLLGAVLHVGYVVAVGGDFMRGRFLIPPLAAMGVALCFITRVLPDTPTSRRLLSSLLAVALALHAAIKLHEFILVGLLSGFLSLRTQEATPRLVLLGAAMVTLVLAGWAVVRFWQHRRFESVAVAVVVAQITGLLALTGYTELYTGLAVLLLAGYVISAAVAIRARSEYPNPVLFATAAVFAVVPSSLCPNDSFVVSMSVHRSVTHEHAWYAADWWTSRFRSPIDYPTAYPAQWAEAGRAIGKYAQKFGPVTVLYDTIGLYGCQAGPQVTVIDRFALADAFLARSSSDPESRVGHIEHHVPIGYLQERGVLNLLPNWKRRVLDLDPTLIEEAQALRRSARWADPQQRHRWERTKLVISSPIFSVERWRAIPRFIFPKRVPTEPHEQRPKEFWSEGHSDPGAETLPAGAQPRLEFACRESYRTPFVLRVLP